MNNLYSMLTPVEAAYHDSLVGIAQKFGPFDKGSGSVWVGYEPAEENDDSSIGVKCANCTMHYMTQDGNMGCQILSFLVESEGRCRLAAIPDNLVNPNNDEEDMDEMTEDVNKQAPCWEGYVQRGMKPGKDGRPVPNCVPVSNKYDGCDCDGCTCTDSDMSIGKAEKTYTPNAGMKAAARRALKWKEEGKATGAGTAVGWGRASDIVSGRPMSLSTVKRMYSFFSRHEVDKKGKDFNNSSNPSNGRIMWEAWGGNAGFAWSRKIVNQAEAAKAWSESPFFN